MTGRPWLSPGRPPWEPPPPRPRWWHGAAHRAAVIAALFILDPIRAGRVWWSAIDEYRKDNDPR